MLKTRKKKMGRPKAEWQKKLLELKNYTETNISLTEMEEMTGMERSNLSRTLSRIVKGRRDSIYNANDVYKAMKKKLEGETT